MSSDEEPFDDDGATANTSKEGLVESTASMSEEDMHQHLQLCMKLSAENKINMKNAFGLHLIGIMEKLVKKTDKTDIQQASLSLQASSKIFAGRVESLYKDTISFHGHLQSILSDGKKAKKNDAEDESEKPDDSEKGKTTQRNKYKSFLKSEESLEIGGDMPVPLVGEPHGNFSVLNSAFSTSRTNPKLLESLQLSDDSCTIKCAVPEKCYKEATLMNSVRFKVSPKLDGLLDKLKKLDVSQSKFQSLAAASNASESVFALNTSTPRAASSSPASLFNDNEDIFLVPPDLPIPTERKSEDIQHAREKFDVMNITAETFVNDIAGAITNGRLDQTLLAPNSTIKKVLDRSSRRSSIRPPEAKSTMKKAKEPFFAGKSADDIKHFFVEAPFRKTALSQRALSEWNAAETNDIGLGYALLEKMELDPEYAPTLEDLLRVINRNKLHHNFNHYFNKQSQLWKFSRRRKLYSDDSVPRGDFANQTEKRMASLGGGAVNNPESLALSFQNLSIHDSILSDSGTADPANHDLGPADDPVLSDAEDQALDLPEPFEDDIEQMMVKPPELVRPSCMKYDKRPVNLNTERIKEIMRRAISKHLEVNNSSENEAEQFVLFSAVYEELKRKLDKETSDYLSVQFAFVVLLLLANEKVLFIENVDDGMDFRIMQDISEAEAANNM